MSLINRFKKELFLKILFVGPPKSGKSETLRRIFEQTGSQEKNGLLVQNEDTVQPKESTVFFEFLPLTLGQVADFNVRLHLFAVPGSGRYDAITRMMLRGVDGVVCVLPATLERVEDCKKSIRETQELLSHYGKKWGELPVVFQYTFTDSIRAMPQNTLRELYNPGGFPEFATSILKGEEVMEMLRGVTHEVLNHFKTGEFPSLTTQ